MINSFSAKTPLALAAVCLASLMFGLEISSVPVILSVLEKVLHGNFNELQWVMTAYTLACTAVLMAAGTLADRFGRKRVFLISLVMFGATSLVCGLAQNMAVLIAARFLQGISGGIMLIGHISVLSHLFADPKQRARAFAAWGVIFGIGLGFGPIIGGAILALLDWKWVFLVHAVVAAITFVLACVGVTESSDQEAKTLDLFGMGTYSLAVFCLVFFITQGPVTGFTSAIALTVIGLSLAGLVAFVMIELRHPYPMFDFSVFKVRNFSGAIFGSMGMNFCFWPFMIYLPLYFQGALGYSNVATGLSVLAYTLPTLVIPPVAEKLTLRFGPGIVIPLGLFTIGLGFILMRLGSSLDNASWLTMLPGAVLAGTGLGLTNTPVTNTATGAVASNRAGMASGIDMSARLTALAINIALMGFILISGVSAHLQSVAQEALSGTALYSAAERIASGNLAAIASELPGLSASVIRSALIHGYGWVLLYGAISVWILALCSYLVFRPRQLSEKIASA